MPSLLIQIEGTDGSGKTLQTQLLKKRLKEDGHAVKEISFPQYGTPSAVMIEEYLHGKLGSAEAVGAKRASILYAVDRWAASETIAEWLTNGTIVIANRYVASNMGHQGGKIRNKAEREAFFEWAHTLDYTTFGIPKPDFTLFLHMPPEMSQILVDKKDARSYLQGKMRDIHENDIMHLRHAEEAYLHLLEYFNDFTSIACTKDDTLRSPEDIHEEIYTTVSQQIVLE